MEQKFKGLELKLTTKRKYIIKHLEWQGIHTWLVVYTHVYSWSGVVAEFCTWEQCRKYVWDRI